MKLTRIDELCLGDHYFLTVQDECYFLREYTAREKGPPSETNQIIHNIKKSPDRRGRPEWRYKEQDLKRVAAELKATLSPQWLRVATLVPVPPHVVKSDPLYDDRISQILKLMDGGIGLDIRELVVQRTTLDPSHGSASRPKPHELQGNYEIDEALCTPTPKAIGIIDDIVTAGAHFRAMKDMLGSRFPGISVVGIFFARRITAQEDPAEGE